MLLGSLPRKGSQSAPTLPEEADESFSSTDYLLNTAAARGTSVPSIRYADSAVITELMCRVRATFLEVVRHIYWEHIREGKIPRDSNAATALLYSVDVGMDTVNTPGLQDWERVFN